MPTALVTGASRGLGLAFTRQYLEDGWHVIDGFTLESSGTFVHHSGKTLPW